MVLKSQVSILRVFSVDYLCGEIYVTKYVYVDSEEYLNLFKYDYFYTLLSYNNLGLFLLLQDNMDHTLKLSKNIYRISANSFLP